MSGVFSITTLNSKILTSLLTHMFYETLLFFPPLVQACNRKKYQSFTLLAIWEVIPPGLVDSLQKEPVMWKVSSGVPQWSYSLLYLSTMHAHTINHTIQCLHTLGTSGMLYHSTARHSVCLWCVLIHPAISPNEFPWGCKSAKSLSNHPG